MFTIGGSYQKILNTFPADAGMAVGILKSARPREEEWSDGYGYTYYGCNTLRTNGSACGGVGGFIPACHSLLLDSWWH